MSNQEFEIGTMSLEELWNLFKRSINLDEDYEVFAKVMNGIKIEFLITNYLQNFNIFVRERKEKIRIGKKIYKKELIEIELILREQLMYNYLMERYAKKPVAKERDL